jgi:uncharacterized membrane protein YfbV (UPF0208 family)
MEEDRMKRRLTPSMAVALIALFFALGGIGTAATTAIVPLAKRAFSADNAKKLERKNLGEIAAMPGPATATTKTAALTLAPSQQGYFTIACDSGQAAISGGYSYTGNVVVLALDTHPLDAVTWRIFLANTSTTTAVPVALYVICLDVDASGLTFRAPASTDEHPKRVLRWLAP